MFDDSWDSCPAGIVQLFGEFCNVTQLGLVFPDSRVGSSWTHIISALRNNLGGNLEGSDNTGDTSKKVSFCILQGLMRESRGSGRNPQGDWVVAGFSMRF